MPAKIASPLKFSWDFAKGAGGWHCGATDFPVPTALTGAIDFVACLRPLPAETGHTEQGWYQFGRNVADDLFMFIARSLTAQDGIQPSVEYDAEFTLHLATCAAKGSAGIGGSPAHSVFLKVGGSSQQPHAIAVADSVEFSLDKGNQLQSGPDMTTIGDMSNGIDEPRWVLVERKGRHAQKIRAGRDGVLWLAIGTDSGFEGHNQLYYTRIQVTLTPAGQPQSRAKGVRATGRRTGKSNRRSGRSATAQRTPKRRRPK